jgi:hypothetical protein
LAWSAQQLIAELQDKLGMGVLVSSTEEGPPFRITAVLVFGIQQIEVVAEGRTEADAWRELARKATKWRGSNEVSIYRNWWGA